MPTLPTLCIMGKLELNAFSEMKFTRCVLRLNLSSLTCFYLTLHILFDIDSQLRIIVPKICWTLCFQVRRKD